MTETRLSVAGSFGFGNAGDEAVPMAIADLMRDIGASAIVDVLSRFDDPDDSTVIGMGAGDASRRVALKTQPFLICGGGVIEPRDQCVLLRCQPALESVRDAPRILFAANVETGCSYGWSIKRKLRRALAMCDVLTVRDVRSAEMLQSLVPKRDVSMVGDVVLAMRSAAATEAGDDRPFIAVSLAPRWGNDPAWLDWISRELDALSHHLKARLVFLPMSTRHDDDRPMCESVISCLPDVPAEVVDISDDPRQLAAWFGRAQLTVAMRLHGCVMSAAAGTPFIGIAYHPKVKAFAETMECGACCLPETLPDQQSGRTYGYGFTDLNMKRSLVDLADQVDPGRLSGVVSSIRSQLRSALSDALRVPVASGGDA